MGVRVYTIAHLCLWHCLRLFGFRLFCNSCWFLFLSLANIDDSLSGKGGISSKTVALMENIAMRHIDYKF